VKILLKILLALLILSGCSIFVDEYQRDQRKVIKYLLEDLPLPEDASIVKVPTVLLGTGDAISGRITLISQYSPAENLIFYSNNTPQTGWTLVSSKVGKEITMVYTKNGRFATIVITQRDSFRGFVQGSWASDLVISVVHPDSIANQQPFSDLDYPIDPVSETILD
tara:strand:+ start:203 stop:700 length:498 start_codon:yes stop_codon:yes gene_type:complete